MEVAMARAVHGCVLKPNMRRTIAIWWEVGLDYKCNENGLHMQRYFREIVNHWHHQNCYKFVKFQYVILFWFRYLRKVIQKARGGGKKAAMKALQTPWIMNSNLLNSSWTIMAWRSKWSTWGIAFEEIQRLAVASLIRIEFSGPCHCRGLLLSVKASIWNPKKVCSWFTGNGLLSAVKVSNDW